MMLKFVYVILAAFVTWQLFTYVRLHPEAFSKENFSKSWFSLGILALLLMGFVAVLVLLVKH